MFFLNTCLYQSHFFSKKKKWRKQKTPEQLSLEKKKSGNICVYYKNA